MSFGWMSTFRSGQWLSLRSFSLNERKSVEARINHINAEIKRIGEITVFYETMEDDEGNITATERRTGFSVSSGSSLERLVQAYVVQGGNPLDISMFLMPDRVTISRAPNGDENTVSLQPSYGVVYPLSSEFYQGPIYEGGFASILKYPPRRMGGRKNTGDATTPLVSRVQQTRKWVAKEIRYKRNNLEDRIKKLCDLREQLIQERDDIIQQAIGETVSYVAERYDDRYSDAFTLSKVVSAIDALFFEENPDVPGEFNFDEINLDNISRQPTIYPDAEDGLEDFTAL